MFAMSRVSAQTRVRIPKKLQFLVVARGVCPGGRTAPPVIKSLWSYLAVQRLHGNDPKTSGYVPRAAVLHGDERRGPTADHTAECNTLIRAEGEGVLGSMTIINISRVDVRN